MPHFLNSAAFSQDWKEKYILENNFQNITAIFCKSNHKNFSSIVKKFHINTSRNKKQLTKAMSPLKVMVGNYNKKRQSRMLTFLLCLCVCWEKKSSFASERPKHYKIDFSLLSCVNAWWLIWQSYTGAFIFVTAWVILYSNVIMMWAYVV